MTVIPKKYRSDLESEKFRTIGLNADETGIATQLYGEETDGTVLPILVVDDGNGYGKISVTIQ